MIYGYVVKDNDRIFFSMDSVRKTYWNIPETEIIHILYKEVLLNLPQL